MGRGLPATGFPASCLAPAAVLAGWQPEGGRCCYPQDFLSPFLLMGMVGGRGAEGEEESGSPYLPGTHPYFFLVPGSDLVFWGESFGIVCRDLTGAVTLHL